MNDIKTIATNKLVIICTMVFALFFLGEEIGKKVGEFAVFLVVLAIGYGVHRVVKGNRFWKGVCGVAVGAAVYGIAYFFGVFPLAASAGGFIGGWIQTVARFGVCISLIGVFVVIGLYFLVKTLTNKTPAV